MTLKVSRLQPFVSVQKNGIFESSVLNLGNCCPLVVVFSVVGCMLQCLVT